MTRPFCIPFFLAMAFACTKTNDSAPPSSSEGDPKDSGKSGISRDSGAPGTDSGTIDGGKGNPPGVEKNDSGAEMTRGPEGGTQLDAGSVADSGALPYVAVGTDPGKPEDCRIWLAPDGDDANKGTAAKPVASLGAAYDLLCPKPPSGTENGAECLGPAPRTICVRAGTYTMRERFEFRKTRMGTAEKRITVQGDPSAKERPLFDFSEQERLTCGANPDNIGGFTVNAHYVSVRNLAIKGANDNCILVQGYEGVIENVLTYECADSGIQISSGGNYEKSGHKNTIINCDSHSNNDVQCRSENADGFAVKIGTGPDNALIGCRAWNNADDGFDLGSWTSPVLLENNWAFDQCKTTQGIGGECNGFMLGGNEISAAHQLKHLVAVGNVGAVGRGNGFTRDTNPAELDCFGTCAAWRNGVNGDGVRGVNTKPIPGVTVEHMASDEARDSDRSLRPISAL